MAAPAPSRLDSSQVLQGSFDESTGRLRTDSLATVVNADIDVSLDATEDNVAIADPDGDFLAINPDGSINVVVSATAGSILTSQYSEVTGIVQGITTLIGSYLAVPNRKLQKIEFSGTNIAEYELVINGNTEDKKRTYFGNSLNGIFDFGEGIPLVSGQLVEVYVIHNRPSLGDFNIRIQILEI
jgi:hypothetical protein